jgi:hypothetical protein
MKIQKQKYISAHPILVRLDHHIDQVSHRAPEVASIGQMMFVYKQDIMFEAGIQMRLQSKLYHDRVVVAIDMSVNSEQALENLLDHSWKRLREWNADFAWEHRLVVNVALDPGHQMLDILWGRHLGRSLELVCILPKVFESIHGSSLASLIVSSCFLSREGNLTLQLLASQDMSGVSKIR